MWTLEEYIQGGARLREGGEREGGHMGLTVRYLRMSGLQDSEAQ